MNPPPSFRMQGLFPSTGPGAGLKGGTVLQDLAVHLRPLSYLGLRLSHIPEIAIYHVSSPGLSPIFKPPSIPYVPLDSNPQFL